MEKNLQSHKKPKSFKTTKKTKAIQNRKKFKIKTFTKIQPIKLTFNAPDNLSHPFKSTSSAVPLNLALFRPSPPKAFVLTSRTTGHLQAASDSRWIISCG
jgi:hypothetical protein